MRDGDGWRDRFRRSLFCKPASAILTLRDHSGRSADLLDGVRGACDRGCVRMRGTGNSGDSHGSHAGDPARIARVRRGGGWGEFPGGQLRRPGSAGRRWLPRWIRPHRLRPIAREIFRPFHRICTSMPCPQASSAAMQRISAMPPMACSSGPHASTTASLEWRFSRTVPISVILWFRFRTGRARPCSVERAGRQKRKPL
jgi:hypothetical protein